MFPRLHHGVAIIGMLVAIPALAVAQQQAWSLSAEAGWAGMSGASRDPTTEAAFRPTNTLVLGLAAHRHTGAIELGIMLRTARSDLTIADGEVTITTDDLRFTLYELAPELGTRLIRVSQHANIRFAAGPVIDLWRVTGSDSRVRVGGRAALTLESLVADGLSGVVRAEGAVTGSMFDEGELPPEFEERRAQRVLISLGLRYHWR
jgi:hypothetical protein